MTLIATLAMIAFVIAVAGVMTLLIIMVVKS